MASDSLVRVIGDLIRRENRMAKEEKAKIKAAEAEAAEPEEDEDEDPVGEPEPEEEPEPEPEEEPEEEPEPEEEEPEDDGAGDTKPSGPDPILVAQVAAIVKKEIADEAEEKKEVEVKLSGKKEKIDTKPKLEQEIRKDKMNFREAIRMSVSGEALIEGYEETVLGILEAAKIDGPLGYEPFFEKGKLFVEKGSEKQATKVLKQSKEIKKIPKIIGEELDSEEYLTMESVSVDGRMKGFKEALRRLTYEKIKQLGISKEGAAEFMAAASAAKREGKKKFKFGGKEYPVTIKVDIPLKGEQKEEIEIDEHKGTEPHKHPHESDEEAQVDESNELQAIMALDDAGISAEINRKGQVVIKKKDKKKAHQALEKSFKKGGWPTLKLEDVELDEASNKKAMKKVADDLEALADKGGTEAPALFSIASRLRKGQLPTGQKVSKQVSAIFKKHGIREEVQKPRTAYEIVSEARTRVITNKPKWEPEDSEPRLS